MATPKVIAAMSALIRSAYPSLKGDEVEYGRVMSMLLDRVPDEIVTEVVKTIITSRAGEFAPPMPAIARQCALAMLHKNGFVENALTAWRLVHDAIGPEGWIADKKARLPKLIVSVATRFSVGRILRVEQDDKFWLGKWTELYDAAVNAEISALLTGIPALPAPEDMQPGSVIAKTPDGQYAKIDYLPGMRDKTIETLKARGYEVQE